ncbi:hypothetical protein [Luteipulveratus mongoliensis]|uniref:hypothetical protein n=1 Tax=Luteipulveratus mongoliensis TaxID=571913 RepID=UPI000AC757BA|nr:hypothetical protein [Luteipulveratus mongoliensis]
MAKKTAGAFDIRNIIAMLIGIYGVVLVFLGLFSADDHELDKADGLNINLWAGLVMVAVAAALVAWSLIRPVVIPPDAELEAGKDGPAGSAPEGGEKTVPDEAPQADADTPEITAHGGVENISTSGASVVPPPDDQKGS